MHNYLSKIRSDPHYLRVKGEAEQLLKKIPHIGGRLAKFAERLKDCLTYLVVYGILFEELGFNYLGPVDGHNIRLLLATPEEAGKGNSPVLIHAPPVKGNGCPRAANDTHTSHGLAPYQ